MGFRPYFLRFINWLGRALAIVGLFASCTSSVSTSQPMSEVVTVLHLDAPATLAQYGGRFLTRGDIVQTVEGPLFTERLVLLEFPDSDSALSWYNDADYQSAAEFRRLASTGRMILQAGPDNTKNPDPKL